MESRPNPLSLKKPKPNYWLVALLILIILALGFLSYVIYTQNQRVNFLLEARQELLTEIASTTKSLVVTEDLADELATRLAMTEEDREELENDLERERRRNEDFADQLDDITDTVGDLDKLSKLDKELLQKYSKVYFLNENYYPLNLRKIDDDWVLEGKKDQYVIREVVPFLEEMLEEAEDDGHDIKITSAYRSFEEQTDLKGQYKQIYGEGANTFSADQGYSEHQLGTTVDLTVAEVGGSLPSFADTEAYEWLLDNAHKYGFVLSYPEGNEFYVFEPWHWRFVGEDLARDLEDDNRSFYDVPQRELDKYLINIFD